MFVRHMDEVLRIVLQTNNLARADLRCYRDPDTLARARLTWPIVLKCYKQGYKGTIRHEHTPSTV